MKVCYFGIYDSEYSRNKILISGLRQNGVEVLECKSNKSGFSKYFDLVKKHWSLRKSYDVMVVGYPGFQSVILAKFITNKPIIFDAFVSMYDSMVLDRKQVSSGSLKAKYFWLLDKISLSISDVILFDTNEHIEFVSREFGINKNKFKRIFVGADSSIFYPRNNKRESGVFKVVFYGHYIPLQGTEYILEATKILENQKDITFEIIGDGPGRKKAVDSLQFTNVNFVKNISLQELSEKIATSDVCLGIFGNTDKARRVIPNKVFECVAMKKPVITADTPALRELFSDNEIFMVDISNPQKIAEAILRVKSDPKEAELFAGRAYDKFTFTVLPEKLGFELKKIINEHIQ
ncbi:MAG TPA: hypothetical protein DEO25_03045 [Candidatus Zambryskibacteria bacterium]|nr:hypothetical protein [Candidatus Zambryskibacteria bacterium]